MGARWTELNQNRLMEYRMQKLRRVGKNYFNSGPILSRLWTEVHQILRRCRRPVVHNTVATKRLCNRKFLFQVLWHSLAKLCTNYFENLSIFVKVSAKNQWCLFMWTRCIVWSYSQSKTLNSSFLAHVYLNILTKIIDSCMLCVGQQLTYVFTCCRVPLSCFLPLMCMCYMNKLENVAIIATYCDLRPPDAIALPI